jgi:hypothetical protein
VYTCHSQRRKLTLYLCIFPFVCAPAAGEIWSTLGDYVGECVLIVKARAVEEREGRWTLQPEESWKGEFGPDTFRDTTPEGYFFAYEGEHGVADVAVGQEIIFFFTAANQPPGSKLARHSTAFPIRDGRVVYGATSDEYRQEYTLDGFKKAIRDLVSAAAHASR